MVLGGVAISFFAFRTWQHIDGYLGLIPGVFAVGGILWIVGGSVSLARRNQMTITIGDTGIELPAFALFQSDSRSVLIRREDILTVSKHEALDGRLIEIATTGGEKMLVQATHYCSLDKFIAHCRKHGFPVDVTKRRDTVISVGGPSTLAPEATGFRARLRDRAMLWGGGLMIVIVAILLALGLGVVIGVIQIN
jgi:hypothetical protein